MSGGLFKSELKRCCITGKILWFVLAIVVLMFLSSLEWLGFYFRTGKELWTGVGAVDLLTCQMEFDTLKIVIVIVISSCYTGSFCRDLTSQYLRHVLCRTDIYMYALARFTANLLSILVISIAACYLFALVIIGMGFPIVSQNANGGLINGIYYIDIIKKSPIAYVGIVGLQFGMVISVFSSMGLLFSVYQPNAFVSIGVAALGFYVAMSQSVLLGTPFDFLNIVGMHPVLPGGYDTPYILSIGWGVMFPLALIAVCCQLFYRKLKRREQNGEL